MRSTVLLVVLLFAYLCTDCCASESDDEARADTDTCDSYDYTPRPTSHRNSQEIQLIGQWEILMPSYRLPDQWFREEKRLMCDVESRARDATFDKRLLAAGFTKDAAGRYTQAIYSYRSLKQGLIRDTLTFLRVWFDRYLNSTHIAQADTDVAVKRQSAFQALMNTLRLQFCLKTNESHFGGRYLQTQLNLTDLTDVARLSL